MENGKALTKRQDGGALYEIEPILIITDSTVNVKDMKQLRNVYCSTIF